MPRSFTETKRLYKSITSPISFRGMFEGGFRDDYYHRSFMEEVQKTELEIFYSKAMVTPTQKKLDRILVGTTMVWDDKKSKYLLPKIELLVDAKADINTKEGGGMWSMTLLARMFYDDHEELTTAFINLADMPSLEPKLGKSILLTSCTKYNYSTMKLLLDRNCEPNRIEKNGNTVLITLCQDYTHRKEDNDHVEQLKCIELLVNYEGQDVKKLKNKWAHIWEEIAPDTIGRAWRDVAEFCIPNINVQPTFRSKTASRYLQSWKHGEVFSSAAEALLGHLFKDVRVQRENYWPRDREEYIKMFNPIWG